VRAKISDVLGYLRRELRPLDTTCGDTHDSIVSFSSIMVAPVAASTGGPLIRVEDADGWKITELESGKCGLDVGGAETSEFGCCSGARSADSLENRESVDRADTEGSVGSAGSAGCRMKRRMLSRFEGQYGDEEPRQISLVWKDDTHNDPLQATPRCGLAVNDVDKSTLPADLHFGFGLHCRFEVGQDHRGL
jgi:hypothetical protein